MLVLRRVRSVSGATHLDAQPCSVSARKCPAFSRTRQLAVSKGSIHDVSVATPGRVSSQSLIARTISVPTP